MSLSQYSPISQVQKLQCSVAFYIVLLHYIPQSSTKQVNVSKVHKKKKNTRKGGNIGSHKSQNFG